MQRIELKFIGDALSISVGNLLFKSRKTSKGDSVDLTLVSRKEDFPEMKN